ncbi:hypothetical protein [Ureibacillus acetophenoni]|uniref:Lipoprotein n=1 Tax=Ureibacillus acetophenoni TaxID=614649 RepID=A0A285UIE7_9BACL|nr:hypothetical protein [Ureibacillus acetophenoni]SOC41467.1 hypothetical protein SAMN05877842_11078 [Ureibacillus acetophenoni]
MKKRTLMLLFAGLLILSACSDKEVSESTITNETTQEETEQSAPEELYRIWANDQYTEKYVFEYDGTVFHTRFDDEKRGTFEIKGDKLVMNFLNTGEHVTPFKIEDDGYTLKINDMDGSQSEFTYIGDVDKPITAADVDVEALKEFLDELASANEAEKMYEMIYFENDSSVKKEDFIDDWESSVGRTKIIKSELEFIEIPVEEPKKRNGLEFFPVLVHLIEEYEMDGEIHKNDGKAKLYITEYDNEYGFKLDERSFGGKL